ncbi:general odorant-binding protein 45-like [Uranotaenia lowii]|uniref:general odorant-binding protein 45-like n=1 Tax=Uranotaenia lowii TaxID=190385 RepID=UPI00247AC006|nr:general odorant-binding protein 45-like [Uranotaenia lowii]
MKEVLTALLLINVYQLPNLQANGYHSVTLKTPVEVHRECRKILQIPKDSPQEGECEDRCEILLARAWDDTRGPAYNMLRVFWRPYDPEDECFIDRTYRCLLWNRDQFNLTSPELCRRASETTLCFDKYYGLPDRKKKLFFRSTALNLRSIVESCRKFQQLSDQDLVHPLNNDFVDSEVTGCLLRCVTIRAGLYSDVEGPNVDRLEQMYGARSLERDHFRDAAQKCVNRTRLQHPEASACRLAAYFVDHCFEELLQEIRAAILEIIKFE